MRFGAWPVTLLMLTGCPYVFDGKYDEVRDFDGDGFISDRFGGPDCEDQNPDIHICDGDGDGVDSVAAGGTDCDDTNAENFPGAVERCDGVDNDCDGAIDNDDPSVESDATFYVDADGDGSGDPNEPRSCQEYADPDNTSTRLFSTEGNDCDDTDAAIGPDAVERCDGFDNNCDGVVDDVGLWFVDGDGDGYGQTGTQTVGDCNLTPGSGVAGVDGDCNDGDANVHPDADEVPYDGIDANCNGDLDDWDPDFDGHIDDAYWAQAQAANEALPPDDQWAIQPGDCDDLDPTRFDGNDEVCDGVDNDCDGRIDAEDLDGAGIGEETVLRNEVLAVFLDVDGDGFGGTSVMICPDDFDPGIHSDTDEDCFDGGTPPAGFQGADPTTVHVGAEELCDEVDNDCDDLIDYAFSAFPSGSPHFLDADGDGFGADAVFACGVDIERRVVAQGDDCNDSDPAVFLGAPEICGDAVRQDCSSISPFDCDGDGYEGLYGTSGTGEDCDDERSDVNVEAREVCDGLDNDCDDLVDSADDSVNTTDLPFWYQDADGDGFGDSADANPVQQCDEPDGSAPNADDCNDADPALNPSTRWFVDGDGDGFGDTFDFVDRCTDPGPGFVAVGGDCNDQEPALHPDTTWRLDQDGDFVGDPTTTDAFCSPPAGDNWVLASNGSDCDDSDPTVTGAGVYYADADADGFGDPSAPINACIEPPASADNNADCDDTDAGIFPGAIELCDALDNDCDGDVDDDDTSVQPVGGGLTGYQDNDLDGVGSNIQKGFCFAVPVGWSEVSGDCDDADPTAAPGFVEVCGNTVDEDCDGSVDPPSWFEDVDGDGFGSGTLVESTCDGPGAGFVTNDDDCNDARADAFPGAPEQAACDGIDHDCDGAFEPQLTWYVDSDGDGYGDDATAEVSCTSPDDGRLWTLTGGDCDDTSSSITFGQIWYADIDEDSLGNGASGRFFCPAVDPDGDGSYDDGTQLWTTTPGDCDDAAVSVGLAQVYYADADGDDWGAGAPLLTCPGTEPPDHVQVVGDCDDTRSDVNPDAPDPLDPDDEDTNCDGADGVASTGQWWPDVDGDGFGDRTVAPGPPGPGRVPNNADCDDTDPTVANGIIVYADDNDNDGYGTTPQFVAQCTVPPTFVAEGGDCNDNDDQIRPFVSDTCDAIDNDCDGDIDEDALPVATYDDLDGDGFGVGSLVFVCNTAGRATVDGDCDDLDPTSYPGNNEECDGRDNDCDGIVDDGLDDTWYLDVDGDGHGGSTSFADCEPPGPNWVLDGTDCDDLEPARFPGAFEDCDGIFDNNCDVLDDDIDPDRDIDGDGVSFCAGDPDDSDPSIPLGGGGGGGDLVYYIDDDGDGFGDDQDGGTTTPAAGLTWALNNIDCDDTNPTVSPVTADDTCDGVDNNCDGVDGFGTDFFPDLDQDGFADEVATGTFGSICTPPVDGFGNPMLTGPPTDCDDGNAQVNPGMAVELCDGIDNDCDGAFIATPTGDVFDVAHPLNGTVLPGDPQTVAFLSTDGDSTPSFTKMLFACDALPDGPTYVLHFGPDLYPLYFDPLAATDCEGPLHFGTGVLKLPDNDNDGYGGFSRADETDIREVILDCDGSAPANYVDIGGGVDCDDGDASRFRLLTTEEPADLDGDGAGVYYPENSCVGAVFSGPITDCNDNDNTGDPAISFNPIDVDGPVDLTYRMQNCSEATLLLDNDDGPWNEPWTAGADLTLESNEPGAPTIVIGFSPTAPGTIRVRNLRLQGSISLGDGTMVFEDSELMAVGSPALSLTGTARAEFYDSKVDSDFFPTVFVNSNPGPESLVADETDFTGPQPLAHARGQVRITNSTIDGPVDLEPAFGEMPETEFDSVLLRGVVDVQPDARLSCNRCDFDVFGDGLIVDGTATLSETTGHASRFAQVFPDGTLVVVGGSIRVSEYVVANEGQATFTNTIVARDPGPPSPLFDVFQFTASPDLPSLTLDGVNISHPESSPVIELEIGSVFATGVSGEAATLLQSNSGTTAIIDGAEVRSHTPGFALIDTSGTVQVSNSLFGVSGAQLLHTFDGIVSLDNVIADLDFEPGTSPTIAATGLAEVSMDNFQLVGATGLFPEVINLTNDARVWLVDSQLFPGTRLATLNENSRLTLMGSYVDSPGEVIGLGVGTGTHLVLEDSRLVGSSTFIPMVDVHNLNAQHSLFYDFGQEVTVRAGPFMNLQNTTIWRLPAIAPKPLIEADQMVIEECLLHMETSMGNEAVADCRGSGLPSSFRFTHVEQIGQVAASSSCSFSTASNDYGVVSISSPPLMELDDPFISASYGEFSN